MAPKKKAVKKAPSVGLRGKKKMVPPAAGLRPKKEKPFRLEVGKTYETRDGITTVKITDLETGSKLFPFHGEVTPTGTNTSLDNSDVFTETGAYWHEDECHNWDLVREVVKRRGK